MAAAVKGLTVLTVPGFIGALTSASENVPSRLILNRGEAEAGRFLEGPGIVDVDAD